ncbi:MAG: hypothetical protein AAF919_11405 [Pseudomonadota bacterium]
MRIALIFLVGLGLLLPRAGAVLAEVAGFDTVVICRGADLVTIFVGEDGTPVETEIAELGSCLSAMPSGSVDRPMAVAKALRPSEPVLPHPLPVLVLRSPWSGLPPYRAPPAA